MSEPMATPKKRRINRAKIDFISLCPRGMNGMETVLKSLDADGKPTEDAKTQTTISKYDDIEGLLYALVYAPEKVDLEGDVASAEVVKQMAHDYMRSGGKIDIRHDGKVVDSSRAAVVESFLVQKADPRFVGVRDYQGASVNPEGAWAVVIKIDDPELRKLYASGAWKGVSMGGTANTSTEKESQVGEKMEKALDALLAFLTKQETKKETPAPEAPKKTVPVFKGSPNDPEALKRFAAELRVHKILNEVDLTDPDAIEKQAILLEEMAKERESGETPEARIQRLLKENADLKMLVKAHRPKSQQGAPNTEAVADAGVGISKDAEEKTIKFYLEGVKA